MKKVILKTCVFITSLILVLPTLTACRAAAGPEDTLNNFQTAYNKLDMNAALDCIEPSQAEAIKSALNILTGVVGGVSGVTIEAQDLLNVLPLFANIRLNDGNGDTLGSAMPKITIAVHSTTMNGNNATCPVTVTVSSGGETTKQDGVCTLVKENGRWYISDMQ
jgi:hypothetical protein